MFGAPGAPPAEVSQAVLASCAVPGVFAPVRIGGREYVDGGVWSPTNLDAAPAGRGSSVLCLVPTALEGGIAPLRAFSLAAVAAETLAVRARGAEVRTLVPDDASAAVMGARPDGPEPLRGRCWTRRSPRAGRSRARPSEDLDAPRVDRAALGDLPDAVVAAALVRHAAVAERVLVVDELARSSTRPSARRCGSSPGRS